MPTRRLQQAALLATTGLKRAYLHAYFCVCVCVIESERNRERVCLCACVQGMFACCKTVAPSFNALLRKLKFKVVIEHICACTLTYVQLNTHTHTNTYVCIYVCRLISNLNSDRLLALPAICCC